uniref:Uncharacterized protein n=1 Tax=Strongyloides stercoralis TaxID=6248 RepID=A0AAF5D171_STRER
MSLPLSTFLSDIVLCSGDFKGADACFKALNNEVQRKKFKLRKNDLKEIMITFYNETSKYPELNKFWGKYTNILQYNNKEFRRLIVYNLIENDVNKGAPCPYRVLGIIFEDKELIKLITLPQTFLQAALQVKNLCPDYLIYLGGDSPKGKSFRANLGNLIVDNWRSLMYPENVDQTSEAIESVLKYINITREKKVWCNLNLEAYVNDEKEDYFDHSRIVKKHNLFNYKKLLVDYRKGKIKNELLFEHLYDITMYEDKREELLEYLKNRYEDVYNVFKDIKYNNDCEIGTIPEEICKFYRSGGYPSKIIQPKFGAEYFSIKKATIFDQCDPDVCVGKCDKTSHSSWFKMVFIEDTQEALRIIEDLDELLKEIKKQVIFIDIKTAIKDDKEYIIYINLFVPKSRLISFNLDKINNSQTMNAVNLQYFATIGKFTEIFRDIFDTRENGEFPVATVVCLINRLNTLVESTGEQCSIPKYFPSTWRKAYQYDSIDYNNDDDDESIIEMDDEEGVISKQQRKCIRNMSLNMEFRNLCYLTTSYDYDESESIPYSYWHRKPLRVEQQQEMMTRLFAMYDILFKLNNAMYKDPEYKNISLPILNVRIGHFLRALCTGSQHYTKTNYNIDEARILFKKLGTGKVTLEKDEEKGIGKICIDNHKKKNAITGKMFVDFENCVNELKEWEKGKIVIVEGKGSDFCSGGDLNFVKEIATPGLGYWMNSYFGGVLESLSNLPIISVANIKGNCLGGGTEIASNCDLRFMHTSGRIGVVQGKMGVIQTWNGASKLLEIVGKHNAIKLLAMSKVFSHKLALEMGFVNEIYEIDDEFNKLIRKLSQNNADVLRIGKEMYMELDKSKGLSSKKLHDIELKYSSKLWGSKHHLEALNSQVKHK